MGGGGKWKKTKWRTFSPESAESVEVVERRERNACGIAENAPRPQESYPPNECQFVEGIYQCSYCLPQGLENAPWLQDSHPANESQFVEGSCQCSYCLPQDLIYPQYPQLQPQFIIYNYVGMPYYPNSLVPPDAMYNQYYEQPPPYDGTSVPIPEDNPPLYPVQLYNPANNGPPVQEYNPENNSPPVQEYNPAMHASTAQECCMPQMQGVTMEEYNSLMQVPAVEEFNPACSTSGYVPLLNDLNNPPFQDCTEGGMQGPYAQDYNIIQFPSAPNGK
ncbi:hypothetical protein JTE90_028812 [Oedothorax gibbosus]|uniref:Uncharacterized protein n=1 Tax=Oedothorax gibbosus TaxID=931172 RepID=A0AAV6VWV7_9ARAC|nr:hypothetical protein JTE90_028812 [Oedothorax gibbosus]